MPSANRRESWLPILSDGSLAQRVNAALNDISETLANWRPLSPPANLADGPAGAALFFHYLDQARPGEGHHDQALAHLEAAIESTAEATSSPALYTGFTGVAWVLEHLSSEADAGAEVARVLAGHVRRPLPHDGYDLSSGLAGLGVWALERGSRLGGEEVLEEVVRRLGEHAERREGNSLTWRTPPEHLIPAERMIWPRGCYKLGVAHGVAGVIGALAAMRSAGLETRELLAEAVEWLLGQRLPPGMGSCFPSTVAMGSDPVPDPRLAWCRGDAGIALALLAAARAEGEPEWERQALGIARAAAARSPDQGEVRDGSLCHGAAGLAHLYSRLFQATGDPLFRAAALTWIERLLAQRQPSRGMAGWFSWRAVREISDVDVELGWRAEAGFLTGIAGIGLALLGAVSPVEPAWDRVLLCSVPPGIHVADDSPGITRRKETTGEEEGNEEGPQAQLRDAPSTRAPGGPQGGQRTAYASQRTRLLPVVPHRVEPVPGGRAPRSIFPARGPIHARKRL